MGFNVESI